MMLPYPAKRLLYALRFVRRQHPLACFRLGWRIHGTTHREAARWGPYGRDLVEVPCA